MGQYNFISNFGIGKLVFVNEMNELHSCLQAKSEVLRISASCLVSLVSLNKTLYPLHRTCDRTFKYFLSFKSPIGKYSKFHISDVLIIFEIPLSKIIKKFKKRIQKHFSSQHILKDTLI